MNDFKDSVHSGMVVERDPAAASDDEDADRDVAVLVNADVRDWSIPERLYFIVEHGLL